MSDHYNEFDAETPAWIPCPDCDEYYCTIHKMHAWECECPPVEDWIEDIGILPYEQGSKK